MHRETIHGGGTVEAELTPLDHRFAATRIAGIRLHVATMRSAVLAAERAITERRRLVFGMVNIAKLVDARHDALLRESLEMSDLVLADGLPVVWLTRLQGLGVPERVAGIDLMVHLLELANRKQFSVYLLGARAEINAQVAERIRAEYPQCRIAGARDGYFNEMEEPDVAREIEDSDADILFVAMSPPKKELFLKRWGRELHVPVCHGVGGSFDVFAGRTRRAPRWMQRTGMEWAYRVWQEPRRLWKRYLVTNTRSLGIAAGVVAQRIRRLVRGASARAETGEHA